MARTRRARFQIVHHGPHRWTARLVGGNGRIVWVTQTYVRSRSARHAVDLILTLCSPSKVAELAPLQHVDGPNLRVGQHISDTEPAPVTP